MDTQFGFFMQECWRNMTRRVGVHLTVFLTVTVALTIVGVFLLINTNLHKYITDYANQIEVYVFLEDNAESPAVLAALEEFPELVSIRYQDRNDELGELLEDYEKEELLDLLGYNPLPSSFHLTLDQGAFSTQSPDDLIGRMEQVAGVEEVSYDFHLAGTVRSLTGKFVVTSYAIIFFLLCAVMLIISNTIKLLVLSGQESIDIMRLVGASRYFVSMPYLLQSLVLGVVSSLAATIIIYTIYNVYFYNMRSILFIDLQSILVMSGFGIVISFLATASTLRRYIT